MELITLKKLEEILRSEDLKGNVVEFSGYINAHKKDGSVNAGGFYTATGTFYIFGEGGSRELVISTDRQPHAFPKSGQHRFTFIRDRKRKMEVVEKNPSIRTSERITIPIQRGDYLSIFPRENSIFY